MELRPYQTRLVERAESDLERYKRVILQLPTGGGKTAIAGAIARLAAERGLAMLALVHRRELLGQFHRTLLAHGFHGDIGIIAAGEPETPEAGFQIASVQTLINRLGHKPKADLIFIDEARHAKSPTWEKVLDAYPDALRLGLDATPLRLDGCGLSPLFKHIINGPSIKELTALGALCPLEYKAAPAGLNLKGIRKVAGDYSRGAMARQVTFRLAEHNAEAINRLAAGRKVLFFGINRHHADLVHARLRALGWNCRYIDGETGKDERRRSVEDFRDGAVQAILNVELFLEGVDLPACDCIFMGAPTLSIARYMQQIGRAMRPGPGKTALIIDAVENIKAHGLPDADRYWGLEGGGTLLKKDKENPPRECRECFHIWQPKPLEHYLQQTKQPGLIGQNPAARYLQWAWNEAVRARCRCPVCRDEGTPQSDPFAEKAFMAQAEKENVMDSITMRRAQRAMALGDEPGAMEIIEKTGTHYKMDEGWQKQMKETVRKRMETAKAAAERVKWQ